MPKFGYRKPRDGYCKECRDLLTEFNTRYDQRGSPRNVCKKCKNEKMNIYNANKRLTRLSDVYKISIEECNKLVETRKVCEICRGINSDGRWLHVDHDHETGMVRGLLCQRCNTAIGLLKEDEDLFWNALEYLKKHKWSKSA